jgi:hypothetical protein
LEGKEANKLKEFEWEMDDHPTPRKNDCRIGSPTNFVKDDWIMIEKPAWMYRLGGV